MAEKQCIRKTMLRYIIAFFLFLAVGYLLLFLTGLVPQHAVLKNVLASVEQLESEGLGARILDNSSSAYQLDTWTDARILLQALYMDTAAAPETILTNSYWDNPMGIEGNALDSLTAISGMNTLPETNTTYERYCMGFRIFVRPLLAMGSIVLLRQVIAWTMTILFFFVAAGFFKQMGVFGALIFIVNYLALNPIVLMSSPQYASCIFIAFVGMMALFYSSHARKNMGMLMFLLGTATQFFDFFTYPLLTALFPICTYLLLEQKAGRCLTLKEMVFACIKGLALWGIAYASVLIFKLGIAALLTEEAAFATAHTAISDYVGPAAENALRYDSKWDVLYHCARIFFVKTPLNFIVLCVLAAMWIGKILFSRHNRKEFLSHAMCYGILALLPAIYILIFARHADIHMFFQYRTLGGSFFAACCAVVSIWGTQKGQITKAEDRTESAEV